MVEQETINLLAAQRQQITSARAEAAAQAARVSAESQAAISVSQVLGVLIWLRKTLMGIVGFPRLLSRRKSWLVSGVF